MGRRFSNFSAADRLNPSSCARNLPVISVMAIFRQLVAPVALETDVANVKLFPFGNPSFFIFVL
jgi:hypothetical protein